MRVYDLDGKVLDDRSADRIQVPFNSANQILTLPRYPQSTPVFFVRCQLFNNTGKLLVDNTYWQSQKDDDMGDLSNDDALNLKQVNMADMTALNTMPQVNLDLTAEQTTSDGEKHITVNLHNPSTHIAFFERASVAATQNGDEILPIRYDDNYITVYPGETAEVHGTLSQTADARWIKLEGYNTPATSAQIQ